MITLFDLSYSIPKITLLLLIEYYLFLLRVFVIFIILSEHVKIFLSFITIMSVILYE